MNQRNIVLYAALFFLYFCFFSISLPAVMIPLSTEQLTGDSDVVLIGEVTGIESQWDSGRTIIFTRATVSIYRVIVGDFGGSTIDVEYEGGEVGEMGMGASDQPRMEIGEKVLLFLESKESFNINYGSVYGVVGAAQGKYSIMDDGIAEKGGFSVVELGGQKGGNLDIPHKMKLKSVEDLIDNHIPVEILADKILGKKIPGNKRVKPGERPNAAASDISRPMYSSHGSWNDWKVSLKINPSGGPSFGLGGVLAAMNEWNNVRTSAFQWFYLGATSGKSSGRNGVNTVYFTGLSGSLLGYSNWWNSGGKIIETDVKLRSNWSWNFLLLRAVAMHELGHSLGLNHVSNTAIMKVPISSSRLYLFQDDIKAVTTLYPGVTPQFDFDTGQAGYADMLLRHDHTGKLSVWLINGTAKKSGGSPGTLSLNWQIKGIADFDNDGNADLFLRDSATGKLSVWLIDGTSKKSGGSPGTLSLSWKLRGIGDFDGDSKADILLRNYQTGAFSVWLIDGTSKKSGASPGTLSDLNWKIQ